MSTDTADKPVAVPETIEPIAEPKVTEVKPVYNPNAILTLITIVSMLIAGVSGYNTLVVSIDRSQQQSIQTAQRVDKMESAVQSIPVMQSQINTINGAVNTANGKLDSLLMRQK